ncbi:Oidioi.mRNA.OKI2018_I69.chr2.g5684.t1.cds [Oikopleura dioica]|uniref:Oidioi.mRNA.OKI2018_I69.chr2.g5684.t1.cds n=1 Tax=Oikopleura dioica TaxID=34765 RepID=A0ABN7TA66_OIKDI|nr:Oidioi.mRNA.OKI2018_I69.chr2.g5684.t1.cds [Oikopleura dioica]
MFQKDIEIVRGSGGFIDSLSRENIKCPSWYQSWQGYERCYPQKEFDWCWDVRPYCSKVKVRFTHFAVEEQSKFLQNWHGLTGEDVCIDSVGVAWANSTRVFCDESHQNSREFTFSDNKEYDPNLLGWFSWVELDAAEFAISQETIDLILEEVPSSTLIKERSLQMKEFGCATCHQNADCVNSKCVCRDGFKGTGYSCVPLAGRCSKKARNPCSKNAICEEQPGKAPPKCTCKEGYTGSGKKCIKSSKICSEECDKNAICINSECICNVGFNGDGRTCKKLAYTEEPVQKPEAKSSACVLSEPEPGSSCFQTLERMSAFVTCEDSFKSALKRDKLILKMGELLDRFCIELEENRPDRKMFGKKRERPKTGEEPGRKLELCQNGVRNQSNHATTSSREQGEIIEVTLDRTLGGLGISITGGADNQILEGNSGVFITNIMKNGSAALDGRLRVGDMLVKIENDSLINERHKKAVKMLQKAPKRVKLIVRRNSTYVRVVQICRLAMGLGFNIVGGEMDNQGIFISYLHPTGVAESTGKIREGDQIVAVNNISFLNMNHQDAVRILRSVDECIVIELSYQPEKFHKLKDEIWKLREQNRRKVLHCDSVKL